MTDTVTAKLAEWEALTEGATEGPWVQNGTNGVHTPNGRCIALTYMALPGVRDQRTPDAEFIAAAREMVPALLGFVREVREGHEAEAEARAFDPLCCARCREEWPCPTELAARKWLGGEE